MKQKKIINIAYIICLCFGTWELYKGLLIAPDWAPLMLGGLLVLSAGLAGYERHNKPQPPQEYEYLIAYELDGPEYRAKGRCSILRTEPISCMADIKGIEEYLQPSHPQGLLLVRTLSLLSKRDKGA